MNQSHSLTNHMHAPIHAQKARVKHPPLQAGQDPLEHTPVLRLVGVLFWVSLRARPDIAWVVARITRLASSDEARARVCIRHVTQNLRWTLHFALFYEPVKDCKWHCYTDASWAPEGDYIHQAGAVYLELSCMAVSAIISCCVYPVLKQSLLHLYGDACPKRVALLTEFPDPVVSNLGCSQLLWGGALLHRCP